MRETRRFTLTLAVVAALVGLLIGGAVLSIALSENPQGEYFDVASGTVRFGNVLPLFLVSFLASALTVLVAEFGLYWLIRTVRRPNPKS